MGYNPKYKQNIKGNIMENKIDRLSKLVNTLYTERLEAMAYKIQIEKLSYDYYKKYLEDGGNARTAKDKVLEEGINNDKTWQDLIQDYEVVKIKIKLHEDAVQISKHLLDSGIDLVDKFLMSIEIS